MNFFLLTEVVATLRKKIVTKYNFKDLENSIVENDCNVD